MAPKQHQRAQTLKAARLSRGWTQEQLAAASGIDQRAISKIERGRVDDPLNGTVKALEGALGLRRGTLVFGEEIESIAS